nr:hypothetical protein [Bacilli bacterium]
MFVDDQYFAVLTKIVFATGFSRRIVESRWSAFEEQFAHFDPEHVRQFDPSDVEKLLVPDSGIVKNRRKVMATLQNAAICCRIAEQYGSLSEFIDETMEKEEVEAQRVLQKTFCLIGESGAISLFQEFSHMLHPENL